jgi:hypothetical protein
MFWHSSFSSTSTDLNFLCPEQEAISGKVGWIDIAEIASTQTKLQ